GSSTPADRVLYSLPGESKLYSDESIAVACRRFQWRCFQSVRGTIPVRFVCVRLALRFRWMARDSSSVCSSLAYSSLQLRLRVPPLPRLWMRPPEFPV